MRRRRYIMLAATVSGLTGCSSDDASTEAPTTESSTSTTTATATDTPTATPTESEPATETETQTDSDTPTETDTPDPGAQARPYIQRSQERLGVAYDEFVSQGDTPTLLGVSAATSFDPRPVYDAIKHTETALNVAADESPTTKQKETIADLQSIATFLYELAAAEDSLSSSSNVVKRIPAQFFDEAWRFLDDKLEEALDHRDAAKTRFDAATTGIDTDTTSSFDRIDQTEYEEKVAQIQREIDTLSFLDGWFPSAQEATKTFASGNDAFDEEEYTIAQREYQNAADSFQASKEQFSDFEIATAYTFLPDMDGAMMALSDACEHLVDAAAAASDGANSLADQYRQDAADALESHSDVAEMPTAQEVIEKY